MVAYGVDHGVDGLLNVVKGCGMRSNDNPLISESQKRFLWTFYIPIQGLRRLKRANPASPTPKSAKDPGSGTAFVATKLFPSAVPVTVFPDTPVKAVALLPATSTRVQLAPSYIKPCCLLSLDSYKEPTMISPYIPVGLIRYASDFKRVWKFDPL
jgi:hypothetical protein